MRSWIKISLIILLAALAVSCEKEIPVALPVQTPALVVEASINDKIPSLNYVYITQTLDYFSPRVDMWGVSGAQVFISEGEIRGADTIYPIQKRWQLYEIGLPGYSSGLYFNYITPRTGHVYKLEINYRGTKVTGVTKIPERTPIASSSYYFEGTINFKRRALLSIDFIDPPEPSYYRVAYTINRDSNLLGFGAADRLRLLSDENYNNQRRTFNNFQPFTEGDTINVYLCRLGRREYVFWQSFIETNNSGGPFSTPAQLRSNIKGAIGSFTGYSIDYKRVYIR